MLQNNTTTLHNYNHGFSLPRPTAPKQTSLIFPHPRQPNGGRPLLHTQVETPQFVWCIYTPSRNVRHNDIVLQ